MTRPYLEIIPGGLRFTGHDKDDGVTFTMELSLDTKMFMIRQAMEVWGPDIAEGLHKREDNHD